MLFARAMEDVPWWFGTFVWTFDPREPDSKMPMVLFPKQAEVVGWLQEREAQREGGLIEKSRDFGLTWLCAGYAVHGWRFRPGVRFGFGSRKLEYVDNSEDDKTIFAKLRYIVDNLPWWMKPRDFLSKYLLLKNYDNGSSISGEGGDSIGRGDRTTMYFVDEHAFLERADKADAALSQTTNCQIDVSTANGIGNAFYRKRHGGRVPVIRCHWKDDPRKDQVWYQKQRAKLDEVTVAQEIDIDYTASIEGICIPAKWVRAAVNAHLRIEMPQGGAPLAAVDLAGGGANQNVLGFLRGCVLDSEILAWRHESPAFNAQKIKDACRSRHVAHLNYDNGGGYGGGVGDMARDADDPPGFPIRALDGGEPASLLKWPEPGDEGRHKTSRDKFINARAEWWWLLRERFRKTWEHLENGVPCAAAEMISIPNHADLIADLSKPKTEPSHGGRIAIESKKAMAKRGVASPDFGDMLAMLMAPEPPEPAPNPTPQPARRKSSWMR